MPRLIRIETGALMEVLGSVEHSSPDPRRNTSKDFFEAPPSGNKETTCCCFVAGLLPLLFMILGQEARNWQHVATSETSIFIGDADYDAW